MGTDKSVYFPKLFKRFSFFCVFTTFSGINKKIIEIRFYKGFIKMKHFTNFFASITRFLFFFFWCYRSKKIVKIHFYTQLVFSRDIVHIKLKFVYLSLVIRQPITIKDIAILESLFHSYIH